jgi:hypothetical protein
MHGMTLISKRSKKCSLINGGKISVTERHVNTNTKPIKISRHNCLGPEKYQIAIPDTAIINVGDSAF